MSKDGSRMKSPALLVAYMKLDTYLCSSGGDCRASSDLCPAIAFTVPSRPTVSSALARWNCRTGLVKSSNDSRYDGQKETQLVADFRNALRTSLLVALAKVMHRCFAASLPFRVKGPSTAVTTSMSFSVIGRQQPHCGSR